MKVWMVCGSLMEVKVPNVTVLEIRRNLLKLKHEKIKFGPRPFGSDACQPE